METTYLIQRLDKPVQRKNNAPVNPFSFGAGSSGLEEKTEEALANIWSWHYMGAAEFENGIVNNALKMISEYSQANDFATGICKLDDKKKAYYICKKEDENGVKKIITQLYDNENAIKLKAPALLKPSFEERKYFKDTLGWLELNNGFMFFKGKKMYAQTLEFFGIK
ncbi:MAG: hypothetical protein NTV63_05215 [Candidatus Woesearchaeota archaeon]|nr:hypothetical protein [Candidatus Woesearchaeota archaeon]